MDHSALFDISEILMEVFSLDKIKQFNLSGKSIGCGWTDVYELIIKNHSEYKSQKFIADIKKFHKKIQNIFPDRSIELNRSSKQNTGLYIYDLNYKLKIDDVIFNFGRRYHSGKYGLQDGCSHIYYVVCNNFAIIDYLNNVDFLIYR